MNAPFVNHHWSRGTESAVSARIVDTPRNRVDDWVEGVTMKTAIQIAQLHTTVLPNHCWEWLGGKTFGYATQKIAGKTVRIHREVYRTVYGELADDVHHLCENRACLNPSHLTEVSHGDHPYLTYSSPAFINKTKTHCKNGHEYSGKPLRVRARKDGRINRICRTCSREKNTIQHREKRLAIRLGLEQNTA